MTVLGLTWREVGHLPYPIVNKLFRYWRKNPPVHEVAAAFAGYKPPPDAEDAPRQQSDNKAAIQMLQSDPQFGLKKGEGEVKDISMLPLWLRADLGLVKVPPVKTDAPAPPVE